jgi:hypothetical protein
MQEVVMYDLIFLGVLITLAVIALSIDTKHK